MISADAEKNFVINMEIFKANTGFAYSIIIVRADGRHIIIYTTFRKK